MADDKSGPLGWLFNSEQNPSSDEDLPPLPPIPESKPDEGPRPDDSPTVILSGANDTQAYPANMLEGMQVPPRPRRPRRRFRSTDGRPRSSGTPFTVNPEDIRPLRDDEMTARDLRQMQYDLRLFVEQKALEKKLLPDPPDGIESRQSVWKVICFELPMIAFVIGGSWFLWWIAFGIAEPNIWVVLSCVGIWLLGMLVMAWVIARIFEDWRTLTYYSDLFKTGKSRKQNRLLLLPPLTPSITTQDIQTRDPTKGFFATFFNLNVWRLTLDSPNEADRKHFTDMRWIRHADKWVGVIEAFKEYHARYLN